MAFALPGILIREWIRHECAFFSTRDANSVKIAQSRFEKPTSLSGASLQTLHIYF